MPAIDDDDRPKKKIAHEIGQDLTLLSVKELDERVALLNEEIARLEADKTKKQAQRLWAIDADTCEAILGALEASQFLGHTRNGEYFIV